MLRFPAAQLANNQRGPIAPIANGQHLFNLPNGTLVNGQQLAAAHVEIPYAAHEPAAHAQNVHQFMPDVPAGLVGNYVLPAPLIPQLGIQINQQEIPCSFGPEAKNFVELCKQIINTNFVTCKKFLHCDSAGFPGKNCSWTVHFQWTPMGDHHFTNPNIHQLILDIFQNYFVNSVLTFSYGTYHGKRCYVIKIEKINCQHIALNFSYGQTAHQRSFRPVKTERTSVTESGYSHILEDGKFV